MPDGAWPLHGLILAAGASTRMGAPKALLDLGGSTFLGHLVDHFRAVGCASVVVVAGAHYLEIRAKMPLGARLIEAEAWALGMRASLRAGVEACPTGDILLTHVDRPGVQLATLATLRDVQTRLPVVPTFNGAPGHPVRLPAHLRPRLLEPDDTPLRDLITDALEVPVPDENILININDPEDLMRLRLKLSRPLC